MTTKIVLPSEEQEQAVFVAYLRLKGYPHFRVPNETYTKSWNQKRKNKMLGVSSGVPDLFVIAGGSLCAIEMKRQKGGVLSDNQKKWVQLLNEAGIETVVCKGADEAIEYINERVKYLL